MQYTTLKNAAAYTLQIGINGHPFGMRLTWSHLQPMLYTRILDEDDSPDSLYEKATSSQNTSYING